MARACRAAEALGDLREYCRALFDAIFVEHRVITPTVCADVAAAIGQDRESFLAGLNADEIDRRVTADALEALRRGAFGVPTFFVGDEMFWGNDRLPLLEAHLQSGRRE